MPQAVKKLKYDAFDGEIAIKPNSFYVSGSDGAFVDVPLVPGATPAPNTGVDYYSYIATSSNHPFLPPVDGKKLGVQAAITSSEDFGGHVPFVANSVTSSPGKNAYHYRRIPFVHKIGGSNSIATIGNQILAEEIVRFQLYGKGGSMEKGVQYQSPFSAGMIQWVTFPFGRSAPASGETNSYEAADNFIHARGNLRSTRYYRQPLTFTPAKISDDFVNQQFDPLNADGLDPDSPTVGFGGVRKFALYSGSGDNSSNYTQHFFDHRESRVFQYVLNNKPEVIFDNNVGILNPLGQHGAVLPNNESYGMGDPPAEFFNSGFRPNYLGNYIHPALTEVYPIGHQYEGRAKYYILTQDNPFGPGTSNDGPITPAIHGNNAGYYSSNPDYGRWPYNPWVGTNTSSDPNPPIANGSGLANFISVRATYAGGHQGFNRGNLMASLSMKGYNDRGEKAGTIIKGLIELY